MGNYSVLLAEEDNASAVVCIFLLSERGCKIDLVRDGKSVIEKCQSNHYDLILIDIGFTDGSTAITRKIRAEENKQNKKITPIIGIYSGQEKSKKLTPQAF